LALVSGDGQVERGANGLEVDARVLLEDRGEEVCPERLQVSLLRAGDGRRRRDARPAAVAVLTGSRRLPAG
jgi:hypothetical protein